MGKQVGILPLRGSIDNLNFYQSADGYRIRKKGGVDTNRILKDKAFERTRENMAEFGRACGAAKVLRLSFNSILRNATDRKANARLVSAMTKVIKADTTSDRGFRNVIDGEATLLEGFDFNLNGILSATYRGDYAATIDRVTGKLMVEFPPFISGEAIVEPDGATHFRIVTAASEIDFEKKLYKTVSKSTAVIPLDNSTVPAIALENNLPAASTHPLFLILGIEFFQEMNGKHYPLKNGSFNALKLVKVSGE